MQRELTVNIEVFDSGYADISITDNETSDEALFTIGPDVDCNNADELAMKIGYELLSWVDMAR